MPILILGLVLAVVLGFALWVIRGDTNDDRSAGFNPLFGTGGDDFMDPERGQSRRKGLRKQVDQLRKKGKEISKKANLA